MKLTGNNNLSPEVLKKIDEIPVVGLGTSGVIADDLFTPSVAASLIEDLKAHDYYIASSLSRGGRKVIC